MTPRRVALDALVRVEAGAFSHVLVPSLLRRSGLTRSDRAFVTHLVYGTLRERRRLDALVAPNSRRPLATLDAPARNALRLGVYQLLHGIPPHAALAETVDAVPERGRGYVNAVLRAVAANGPPWPEPQDVATSLSYPDWIVAKLSANFGETESYAALAAGNEPAGVTLRPNLSRTSTSDLEAELRRTGVEVRPGTLVPGALVTRGIGDPAALAAIREGRATPQDEASQAVVTLLAPREGERVLDVAAGPGGKATAIGELVEMSGTVVALDLHGGRLRLVADAARRLGLHNVQCMRADGRHLPVAPGSFDRVLLDAPCSGLGVLQRRPEARWRARADAIETLAALQRSLLAAAASAVRPGGLLVYSVCTLTAEETVEVGEHAVATLTGFEVLEGPGSPWRTWGPGALLLPHDAGTDGMFVLALHRRR